MKNRLCALLLAFIMVVMISVSAFAALSDISAEDQAFVNYVSLAAETVLTGFTVYPPTSAYAAVVAVGLSWASAVWDATDAGEQLAAEKEFRALQLAEYWKAVAIGSELSEADFRSFYTEVVAAGGDPAYFYGSSSYSSAVQQAILDAYTMVLYTSQVSISLDELCEYIYSQTDEDTYIDTTGGTVVGGESFNDIVDRLNEQYGPEQKADRRVVSLQNPIHPSYSVEGLGWSNLTGTATSRNCIPIRLGADMLLGQDLSEVWFFPFVDDADNGMVYYCGFQYRIYHLVNDDQTVSLMADAYNCVDTSAAVATYTLVEDLAKYPYVIVKMGYPEGSTNRGLFACFGFDSLADFLKYYAPGQQKYIASVDMISSDNVLFSTVYDLIRADTFDPVDDGDDVGFITSQTKFNIGFMSTPLPDVTDNYYITINGDNIYEYIITNPDTGESTTIYNYITNNYYFPDDGDDSDDDDDSGSGTTTGDVTVGGTVKVDGDIDVGGKVDININITDDTGNTGTAEAPPSYIDGVNVDLDSYLDQVPEISDGFISYLTTFFQWLPAEVLSLIVLGLVVAVWCRLAGR